MTDYRRKLWVNILEDLGPPEGCIVPIWLRLVYVLLFPVNGFHALVSQSAPFDIFRLCWTIHGNHYSDRMFALMSQSDGKPYRFARSNGVVTIVLHRDQQSGSIDDTIN